MTWLAVKAAGAPVHVLRKVATNSCVDEVQQWSRPIGGACLPALLTPECP
jgi:hypothetical protein